MFGGFFGTKRPKREDTDYEPFDARDEEMQKLRQGLATKEKQRAEAVAAEQKLRQQVVIFNKEKEKQLEDAATAQQEHRWQVAIFINQLDEKSKTITGQKK